MKARHVFERVAATVVAAWRELAAFAAAGWLLWPGMQVDPMYGPAEIGLGRAVSAGFLLLAGVGLYAVRRLGTAAGRTP